MIKSLLRIRHVIERVGLSRSAIYQRIKDGEFPKPISLGGRAVAWVSSEIDEFIERQIAVRGQRA
jgi:prophage regulatory protein